MSFWQLVRRSWRFYWRSQWGVALGTAVAGAALVGAFLVASSIRATLQQQAGQRLAGVAHVIFGHDRFFRAELADGIRAELPVMPLAR